VVAYRSFRTAMHPPDLIVPANTGLALSTRPAFDWSSVDGASSYTLQVSTAQDFGKLLLTTSPTASTYVRAATCRATRPCTGA